MAARSRGLGITSQDMEASRLVFVFVKDSKPRRKVAIPVPDTYTWDQFLSQAKAKLKLTGIGEIYFSATGVKVTSVSQLQDIDELCVVEGPAEVLTNGNGLQRAPSPLDGVVSPTSSLQQRQQSIPQDRHKLAISTDGLSMGDESDHKYARRAHPLKRSLQRLFPNLFAPGLPVTNRDALDASADGNTLSSKPSRRRRVKRSPYNLRNLLLVLFTMCCVAMMLYLFIWVSSSPAMMSAGMGHDPAAAVSGGGDAAAAAAGGGAGAGSSQQAVALAAAGHGNAGGGGGGNVQPQHPDAAAAGAVPQVVPAVAKQPAGVVGAATGAGAGSLAAAAGQQAAAASLSAAEAAGRAAAAAVH